MAHRILDISFNAAVQTCNIQSCDHSLSKGFSITCPISSTLYIAHANSICNGTVCHPVRGNNTKGNEQQKKVKNLLVCLLYARGTGHRTNRSQHPTISVNCSNKVATNCFSTISS